MAFKTNHYLEKYAESLQLSRTKKENPEKIHSWELNYNERSTITIAHSSCHEPMSGVWPVIILLLESEWGFWIRSEFFWIRSDVFEFGVRFWNLGWGSIIRSEIFKFGVRFWNSEWVFWIRSDVFEFGVRFWNLGWGFRNRSEVQEFGLEFRIRSVVWHSECTCRPPYF